MTRILLIDDDQRLRAALQIYLTKQGHRVTAVEDGNDGVKAYSLQEFDLVITDLIMPEMEGLETISLLRRFSRALPIIAISGGGRNTADCYLEMARQFGADRILAKPFDLSDLGEAVESLLKANSKPEVLLSSD